MVSVWGAAAATVWDSGTPGEVGLSPGPAHVELTDRTNPRTRPFANLVFTVLTSAIWVAEARLGQDWKILNGWELDWRTNDSNDVSHRKNCE